MRWIYTLAGSLCVGLAFLGLFLPLVPVTPFLLLAAFCFSRGSERMHRWLTGHRTFGPILLDWRRYRVIRPKAKRTAVTAMAVLLIPVLVLGGSVELRALSVTITLIAAVLICRCPSRPLT